MLFFIIYFSGYIAGYFSFKYYIRYEQDGKRLPWTKGDRLWGLLAATLSWISVFISALCLLIDSQSDKPAKW